MKLHALNFQFPMTQSHDNVIRRSRGHFKTLRQRLLLNNQRMIASPLKTIRQPGEDRLAVVNHFRRLAMHHLRRANYTPAKRLPDRLMTKTNTQQRNLSRKVLDHFQRDSRRVRRPWSRRDHNPLGPQLRFDVLHRDAIVSMHLNLLTQLAEILYEVVSKRIVVVDNQQHQGITLKSCTILSRLLRAAHWTAVIPSLSLINASAPRLNNKRTASSCP